MAAADARVSALFLQIKHNRQDAQRAIRDIQDIRKSEAQLAKQPQSAGRALQDVGKQTRLKEATRDVSTLKGELAGIARASRVEALGTEFGQLAVKIKDTDAAAGQLEKRLKAIGATEPEIQRAAAAFSAASGRGPQSSTGLAHLGREVRALPAVPIP